MTSKGIVMTSMYWSQTSLCSALNPSLLVFDACQNKLVVFELLFNGHHQMLVKHHPELLFIFTSTASTRTFY